MNYYISWLKNKITVNLILSITSATAIMLCLGFWFGFMHGRTPWHWNGYVLDTDVVGHYGDFVGGVVGSIFSIVLLYLTFYQQRKDSELQREVSVKQQQDSKDNAKIYQKQQLNDDFYHLMELYQNIANSFYYITDDEVKLEGKEALHAWIEHMRNGWDSSARIAKRKQAIISFLEFYALNRDFAPIYFRTIYRLCETIHGKENDTDFKNVEYIKILRAQFTDSEMVMLHYNCRTRMGKKLQYYVNRYNLLKHMPPLDLLEYSNYVNGIKDNKAYYSTLNMILVEIRQKMTDLLDSDDCNLFTLNEYKGNATIAMSTSNKKDTLTITLNKRNNVTLLNKYDVMNCLMKISDDDLESMLSYFLYDSLILMNYQQFNTRKDIEFSHGKSVNGAKTTFTLTAKNNKGKALNITYMQYIRQKESLK